MCRKIAFLDLEIAPVNHKILNIGILLKNSKQSLAYKQKTKHIAFLCKD